LFVSAPAQVIAQQPVISAAVDLLPVQALSPSKPGRCKECGSSMMKKTVRKSLNTGAGVLLTGDEARELVRQADAERKAEEEAKLRRKMEREQRKRDREDESVQIGRKRKPRKRKAAEMSEDKENSHPNIPASASSQSVSLALHPRFSLVKGC